jgi:hypothetical protein
MTTTDTLPLPLRSQYALRHPLAGGPTFVFPQYGGIRVDFSRLTQAQAERLLHEGWPGISRVEQIQPVEAEPTPEHDTTPEAPASTDEAPTVERPLRRR